MKIRRLPGGGSAPPLSALRACVRRRWRAGAVRAAAGERAGVGRRGVLADPLVLPGLPVPLGVAPRLVDRGELAGDLLPVPEPAARDLVGADVDLPFRPGPAHPAMGAGVLEREPLGGQVIGVADVDDRVPVGPGLRLGLVADRVHGWPGRRGPPAQQPRPLERVARQRAQPDHPPVSSPSPESWSSLTASTRTIGYTGSPALATACANSPVAFSIASSRVTAWTTSWAP